jgi:endonuclease YncB( thermonuclease family)
MGNVCIKCFSREISQHAHTSSEGIPQNPSTIPTTSQNADYIYSVAYYNEHKEEYEYKKTKIFIPPLEKTRVYVCKVYDGDTFTISTKLPWDTTHTYRFCVRCKGIDCPELRTKNEIEKKMALQAKEYAIEILNKCNNFVYLQNIVYDKYGRLCADVFLDMNVPNNNFASMMLEKRLAVKYDGGTKVCPKNWELYFTNGSLG